MALFELLVAIAGTIIVPMLGYIARVAHRVDEHLDRIDDHERALYGDEAVDWPGVVDVATRNREAIYGTDREPGDGGRP